MKNYKKAQKQIVNLVESLTAIDPKSFNASVELPVLITMLRLLHVYIVGAEMDKKYARNKL